MINNFKVNINRILSFSLCLILALSSLTGCGKAKSLGSDGIYSFKNISIPGATNGSEDFKLIRVGDTTVYYGTNTKTSGNNNVAHFYFLNKEGEIDFNYNLNLHENFLCDVTVTENGEVYAIAFSKKRPEDIEQVEEEVEEEVKSGGANSNIFYGDPHTNSRFLEDKLGYSLFDARYEAEMARIEAARQAKLEDSSEGMSTEEMPDEMSEEYSGDYDMTDFDAESMEEDTDASDEGFEGNDDEYMSEPEEGEEAYSDESAAEEDDDDPYTITVDIRPSENATDYKRYEENSELLYGSQDGDDFSNEYYFELIKINKDGEIVVDRNLFDDKEVRPLFEVVRGNVITALARNNKDIFIMSNNNIMCYDEEFNLKDIVLSKDIDPNFAHLEFVRNGEGKLYCWYNDASSYKDIYIAEVDMSKGQLLKPVKLLSEQYMIRISPGAGSDFFISKNGNLYGLNYGEEEVKNKIVDFMASDVGTDYISSVAGIDNEHFYAAYRDIEDGETLLGFFTKAKASASSQKTELVMAVIQNNTDVTKMVSNFNKNNDKYRIRLLDYNAMYGNGDYMADSSVIEKLNTDIIAGNMPDILVLDASLPVQTYINKGLLEDLYPYFESDTSINKDDYNTHIFETFAQDGKLYRLAPSYSVDTVIINKDLVGDKKTWTVKEAMDIYKTSNALAFFPFTQRDSIIELTMDMNGSEFIDEDNGLAKFDTDGFRDLLDFMNVFPEELDPNSTISQKLFEDFDSNYKSGKILAQFNRISSLTYYLRIIHSDFNKETVNIGFPTNGDCGSAFVPGLTLAMSGISENKDACWEFLKGFLTEDYQNTVRDGLPILNSAFEAKVKEAQASPVKEVWVAPNGEVYEYELKRYEGTEEIPLEPLSDDEVAYFKDFINSIDQVNAGDNKEMSIIKEECEDYFKGRATKDEVVNRIQSRIQIYLYESQ